MKKHIAIALLVIFFVSSINAISKTQFALGTVSCGLAGAYIGPTINKLSITPRRIRTTDTYAQVIWGLASTAITAYFLYQRTPAKRLQEAQRLVAEVKNNNLFQVSQEAFHETANMQYSNTFLPLINAFKALSQLKVKLHYALQYASQSNVDTSDEATKTNALVVAREIIRSIETISTRQLILKTQPSFVEQYNSYMSQVRHDNLMIALAFTKNFPVN